MQGHLQLHGEFEANLSYLRPHLITMAKREEMVT